MKDHVYGSSAEQYRAILEKLDELSRLVQTTKPKPQLKFIGIESAEELTGYTKSYLYKLVWLKKIPHYKRENRLFFKPDELEKWIEENRVPTAEERKEVAVNGLRQAVGKSHQQPSGRKGQGR